MSRSFLCLLFISLMIRVEGYLDEATMALYQEDAHAMLHPYDETTFLDMWDKNHVSYCSEKMCIVNFDDLEKATRKFDELDDISCTFDCHYLPLINQAACHFTCFATLTANPTCISDEWNGIIVKEWSDEGKLVLLNDFYSKKNYEKALEFCRQEGKVSSAAGVDNSRAARIGPDVQVSAISSHFGLGSIGVACAVLLGFLAGMFVSATTHTTSRYTRLT